MKKRIISVLISGVLLFGTVFANAVSITAADSVGYYGQNGISNTSSGLYVAKYSKVGLLLPLGVVNVLPILLIKAEVLQKMEQL